VTHLTICSILKWICPTLLTFGQSILARYKPEFANVPHFEGNLAFWADYLKIVPISTPEQYSRLLEVSASMNDSKKDKTAASRTFSFFPKSNSTFARAPSKPEQTQARKNAAKEKDVAINMGNLNGQLDSNPVPPALPNSAVVNVHANDEILPVDD
jgi:hypothetical protein